MFRHLAASTLTAMLAAAIIFGCGDDDSGSADGSSSSNGNPSTVNPSGDSDGSASPTKAEFIKQADALCQRETEKAVEKIVPATERLERRGGAQKSEGQLHSEAIVAVILPSLEAQSEQIRELGIPEGDEEEVNAFLATLQRTVDEFREDPPNGKTVEAVGEEITRRFRQVDEMGRAYGFVACAFAGN